MTQQRRVILTNRYAAERCLPHRFLADSCRGHVRDLPRSSAEQASHLEELRLELEVEEKEVEEEEKEEEDEDDDDDDGGARSCHSLRRFRCTQTSSTSGKGPSTSTSSAISSFCHGVQQCTRSAARASRRELPAGSPATLVHRRSAMTPSVTTE